MTPPRARKAPETNATETNATGAAGSGPGEAPASATSVPREPASKDTAAKGPTKRSSAKKRAAPKGTRTRPQEETVLDAATTQPGSGSPAAPAGIAATPARKRPARGAFAAGAERASGERRRRSGTPLLSPTDAVEVSPARRDHAESASEARPASARVAEETSATTPAEAAEAAEPTAPVTVSPAQIPAPRRPRPTRAAIRAERAAQAGPPRLRAVPTDVDGEPFVEPVPPTPVLTTATADVDTEAAQRHTAGVSDDAGPAAALTSGLQSRAERLVGAVLEAAEFTSESRPGPAELVELAVNVLRAAAVSAGLPAEDVERQVAETLAYLRRRLTGDYVVDEFGFDEDYTLHVHLPLLRPLYRSWFRVEVRGIENIPSVGGALVVANHSGTVAMDSLMTQVAVHDEHPAHRHLRMLGADLVFQMPFVGTMARRSGTTLAANTDAERLLSSGHLVGVWPEGFKGVGKPFSERYKLQRFGRGGFVSAAMRAGVPIIPCSIVGAEEIYPILGNMPTVARLLGMPYAPITPTFPWLGPLGLVPLPSKWLIEFGPPIETTGFGTDAADDPMLVFDLTDQVRETIQQTLYSLLMQRKSVFL